MRHNFYSVYIVPKLNSEKEKRITSMVEQVEKVAMDAKLPVLHRGDDITAGTLIIAVGGDGTMLQAMRLAATTGATAIGINMGNVGFLTELTSKRLGAVFFVELLEIMTGRVSTRIEERTLLQASGFNTVAVNEISISRQFADSMITYDLSVSGMSAGTHKANSLLISTATGSTAYSLAAGGSLMMPGVGALQLVPVAAVSMTSRPLVVPSYAEITVKVWGEGVSVRMDGQLADSFQGKFTKDCPYEIQVRALESKARVLHLEQWNFFDVLANKLGWIQL